MKALTTCRNRQRVSILVLVLVGSSVFAAPRPAHAQVAASAAVVAQVIGYIKKAYDVYKQISAFFGPKAKSLATQLAEIKTAIINELRTQRNQQWRADARSVMDDFIILGNRQASDPDNASLRRSAITLAKSTINNYAIIVEDLASGATDDLDSAYQLSPVFNALLTTYTGLGKMKGEIDGYPTTWGEYNLILQRGTRINYKMIGSQLNVCYSTNPGSGGYYFNVIDFLNGYPTFTVNGQQIRVINFSYGDFAKGQLWKKRIGDKYVAVKTPTSIRSGLLAQNYACAASGAQEAARAAAVSKCNPAKSACETYGEAPIGSGNYCMAGPSGAKTQEMLNEAKDKLRPDFDKDPMVKIVRAGMEGLLSIGGGKTGTDESSTVWPLIGRYVDPSTAKCTGGFATYPIIP